MEEALSQRDRRFDRAWRLLAGQGRCDAAGGSEYRRCLDEWRRAPEDADAWLFILYAANSGARDRRFNCGPRRYPY